jgi:hypothetical protein
MDRRKRVVNASVSEDLLHILEYGEDQLLLHAASSARRSGDLSKDVSRWSKGELLQSPEGTLQYDLDDFAV